VHYRDWFDWVADGGFRVAGRDPLATFLAQVTRAPGVRRARAATGSRADAAAGSARLPQRDEDLGLLYGVIERVVGVRGLGLKMRRQIVLAGSLDDAAAIAPEQRLDVKSRREPEGRTLTGKAQEVPLQEQPVIGQRPADEHGAMAVSDRCHPAPGLVHRRFGVMAFLDQAIAV
jgi:hypothetical protein